MFFNLQDTFMSAPHFYFTHNIMQYVQNANVVTKKKPSAVLPFF